MFKVVKNVHAEVDALMKLNKKKGHAAIVIVARRTMMGLSRPCTACQYRLKRDLAVKRIYMVYHVKGEILVEELN